MQARPGRLLPAGREVSDRTQAWRPGDLRTAAGLLLAGVRDPVPTVLDLGCGDGTTTRELLRSARRRGLTPRIIGVDASAALLNRAQGRRWPEGVAFVRADAADLTSLGLPPADAVLASCRAEDPGDRTDLLRDLRRLLVPGGILLVRFPEGATLDRERRFIDAGYTEVWMARGRAGRACLVSGRA